jgi:hypothetical protein
MGTTNFKGILQPNPKVTKTSITKFKGKKQMAAKKASQKSNSNSDYQIGTILLNTSSMTKKIAAPKKISKKK